MMGIVLYAFGFFFMVLAAIAVIAFFQENRFTSEIATTIIIIFVAPGTACIMLGNRIRRRIKRFKQYIFIISTSGINSFEGLAAQTMQDTAFVKKDISSMVMKKYFASAVIDWQNNRILIGGANAAATPPVDHAVTTTCASCGAVLKKAPGMPVTCEYCGSVY